MGFSESYRKLSVKVFGPLVDRTIGSFENLRIPLIGSGTSVLLRSWVSMTYMSTALTYISSLLVTFVLSVYLVTDFVIFLYLTLFVPILAAAFVFLGFYLYPSQKARSVQKSIEIDLPFALSHMSAIASSGIPPEFMFQLITGFEEYKGISQEAKMIVRNIKTLGMSSVTAIEDVAKKTPSPALKQVLTGMAITIEKGGNVVRYLKEMADKSLFDYRLKREQYLKTLSTYADIYTALLVAAPLMMLAVLGVMSIIGGEVLGLGIQDMIQLITWVLLPFLNVIFLMFIHITYPGV